MKIYRLIFVLFLSSLLLLLPFFSSPVTQTLISLEETEVIVNIKSPQVEIETDIVSEVFLNLSYYDAANDEIIAITEVSIFESVTIDLPDRGYYIFTFLTLLTGDVTINEQGVPFSTYMIVFGLLSLNLITMTYHRYRGHALY